MNRWICRDFYEEQLRIAFSHWWELVQISVNEEIKSRIITDVHNNRYSYFKCSTINTGSWTTYLYRHPGNYENLITRGYSVIQPTFSKSSLSINEIKSEYLPKLPVLYFYSNGSRPGSPGWRVRWK